MINFHEQLILPIQTALNNALGGMTGTSFNYQINDVPKNYRYQFDFSTDVGDFHHAEREHATGTFHDLNTVYINGITQIEPISLEGITEITYNALVDATVTFAVPLTPIANKKAFVGEIRRLVDETLQSSNTRIIKLGNLYYQIGTQYSLLRTGNRLSRSSIGDSVEFVLRLTFTVVASGIASDTIELKIDGERIYFSNIGFARKIVKDLVEKSSDISVSNPIASQKSMISGTIFSINLDLPARFTDGVQNTSLNEKIAGFTFTNVSPTMTVNVKYPKTISTVGTQISVSYTEATFSMVFDSVGINGQTGLIASHSITLCEVG